MSETPPQRIRVICSYSGEVWSDADCPAVVVLPSFVRAHRSGFELEVKPIGSNRAAHVAEAIHGGRFTIETDQPHAKVAWRVTPLWGGDAAGREAMSTGSCPGLLAAGDVQPPAAAVYGASGGFDGSGSSDSDCSTEATVSF